MPKSHGSDVDEKKRSDPASSRSKESGAGDRSESSRDNVGPEPGIPKGDRTPGELIELHQRGVWRYLRMLGCDCATADDLTQETFLRVLRREGFVQHNDAATSGYLRRTAYNLLVSRHRKLGRVQTISEPTLLDEIWDRWAGKDLSGDMAIDALKNCLELLSPRALTAIQMRFRDDVSRVEIGESLGISDHGARNLMQRAKQQLRDCIEEKIANKDLA